MLPTLAQDVAIRGLGLHSGIPGDVRIVRRAEDGLGIRFLWSGRALFPSDLGTLARSAFRSTRLEAEGDAIHTPEHLLAAALFFSGSPLDIHCETREPPGMDGSALPFYGALSRAAPEAAVRPAWSTYASGLSWTYEGPEGRLEAEPAPDFSVDYALDRPPLRQGFTLASPDAAVRDVLPARTFIFHRDWKAALGDPGLLRGAGPDSGLLLAESREEYASAKASDPSLRGTAFPLLHPEGFRMEGEPVKHKILDLLGDLALLGLALPRLRLRVRNGGHALNHLLLERLQHERKHPSK